MMTTERENEVLNRLARVVPNCRVYFRPLAALLREVDASREELAQLIGRTAGGYVFAFDRADHLRFERIARPAPPAGVPTAGSPPAAQAFQSGPAAGFDPNVVGKQAQDYQASERKAGREISTTEAVRHVLKQQATARVPQGARGNPFAAENAANEARVAAQLAEVFERCYGKRS